jgi:hypothetical protein
MVNTKPPEVSTAKNLNVSSSAVINTENSCIVIIIHSTTLGKQYL